LVVQVLKGKKVQEPQKKEQKKLKFDDFIMRVHAQTTIDMAITTLKKSIIMEKQSIMPLFIVLNLLKL
jgi:hypothetical protein